MIELIVLSPINRNMLLMANIERDVETVNPQSLRATIAVGANVQSSTDMLLLTTRADFNRSVIVAVR